MAGKEKDLAPLKTPQFAAIFAADLEPELVTCTVGDGLECRFWLRMMDSGDRDRYQSIGLKIKQTGDGAETREADLDLDARFMHLVTCTLVDWEAWQRPRLAGGALGDWQMCRAPEDPRKRKHFIQQQFKCVPAFWDWLVSECARVNAEDGATVKN